MHIIPSSPRSRARIDRAGVGSPPEVLFLGITYVGHRTRFDDLRAHTATDGRIRTVYREINGWKNGGVIEGLPLPEGLRGTLRATLEASSFARLPRPDVIWSSAADLVAPYLWSQAGPLRRPLILDLDWTLEQQEDMAPTYFGRGPRSGAVLAMLKLRRRLVWNAATVLTPWSRWSADALRRAGVPDDRIRVLPPGVDLERWRPRTPERDDGSRALRLLFVGGDFRRKGGDMLVELFRAGLAGRFQLDVVTYDDVPPAPEVVVHRATPNSEALRELYAKADLFVLPTRADTWCHATIEAMASGLPVIVGDVGAARDIVEDGRTGWVVAPTPSALLGALERALDRRSSLAMMGRNAAEVARERFDGRQNDRRVVDLVLELAERHRANVHGRGRGERVELLSRAER